MAPLCFEWLPGSGIICCQWAITEHGICLCWLQFDSFRSRNPKTGSAVKISDEWCLWSSLITPLKICFIFKQHARICWKFLNLEAYPNSHLGNMICFELQTVWGGIGWKTTFNPDTFSFSFFKYYKKINSNLSPQPSVIGVWTPDFMYHHKRLS